MTTFAHIESGRTVDVIQAPDLATYKKLLNAPDSWQIVIVPDDTLSGSAPDGKGGFAPPPSPAAPAATPAELSGSQFHTFVAATLAQVNSTTPLQGMARMGDIIGATEAATGGLVKIAAKRYAAASAPLGKFNLADVTTLIQAMQLANIVTPAESAAILKNWPIVG